MSDMVTLKMAKDTEITLDNTNIKTPASATEKNGFDIKRIRKLETQLRKQLLESGCFVSTPMQHTLHMLAVVTLYGGGYTVLLLQPTLSMHIIALGVLAFANVQAGFIAHEAGHGVITKRRWKRVFLCHFFNTFLTAMSYSHYQSIHKGHHADCNNPAEDFDIQSNVVSLYPESAREKHTRVQQFVTRYQACLIWPLITLQGFSLKFDSLNTVRKNLKTTRMDQAVLVLHFLLWFGLPVYILGVPLAVLNYILMTWLIGPYLGCIFPVNHIGTRVIESSENMPGFTQRLVTARNLGTSRIEDLLFGGVNNHIEHHLFPKISSFKLRYARFITREFCRQQKLPYREMSWAKAIGEVSGYLNQIAKNEKLLNFNR